MKSLNRSENNEVKERVNYQLNSKSKYPNNKIVTNGIGLRLHKIRRLGRLSFKEK